MNIKKAHIIGGGTISHVRAHLALSAPAYGTTARKLMQIVQSKFKDKLEPVLHLTKMADQNSSIETNEDLHQLLINLTSVYSTKVIFWNPAVVDFDGKIGNVLSAKYAPRLKSTETEQTITLSAADKLLNLIRIDSRKDIFLVSFKTTCNQTTEEQYKLGLDLLKRSSSNLVLANDIGTRLNMIIVPEEASYCITTDRDNALEELVEMTYLRSHLTFTRSTVIAGNPISWESDLIPNSLRSVVDYCISRGAYKRFRGVTAGHFAIKIDNTTFLTSRRKTDFNDIKNVGLVKIKTDGPDTVIAYGSKPSVGGQSQRIVFIEHSNMDCIVHFHCPKKLTSIVPTISQREYECGSHECGKNTSKGLQQFGNLKAVYLDQHGPNIVFSKTINPQEVIAFIEDNFNLNEKTGGYVA